MGLFCIGIGWGLGIGFGRALDSAGEGQDLWLLRGITEQTAHRHTALAHIINVAASARVVLWQPRACTEALAAWGHCLSGRERHERAGCLVDCWKREERIIGWLWQTLQGWGLAGR